MKAGKLLLIAVALALALPATASASTFTVNNTGDASDSNAGNNVCATAGAVCTLRAAIEEANAHSGADTIKFSSLFDGTVPASEIVPGSQLPDITTDPLTIDGGNCASSGTAKPCVEIDANQQFVLNSSPNADRVDIRGLSITDGNIFGIALNPGTEGSVKGSWIGVGLDGSADGNAIGLDLESGSAVLGGTTGADRNVFGNNTTHGLRIQTSDNRIRGNYFGVQADGTTDAPNTANIVFVGNQKNGNVIGASIPSSGRATAKCDKGCNVISNSINDGINLAGDSHDTTIKGNFVGLDATGAGAAPNANAGINNVNSPDTTIGGDTSAERNFITGATTGISSSGEDAVMKRNYIGLNSIGTATVSPPSLAGISITQPLTGSTLLSRNRIAGASSFGIIIDGPGGRVVRNKVGLDKDGNDLAGPGTGIRATTNGATIGEPEAGNTVGNTSTVGISIEGLASLGSGDNNVLQGNYVGTDSAGANHSNDAVGIKLSFNAGDVDSNKVGGTSSASENVVSNSGNDAIQVVDATAASTGNQLKRNRGKGNNGLFIDLGPDGFGNAAGPNGSIVAPTLSTVPSEVTRTHAEGTGANPGATIYIFRTTAGGVSPNHVNGFVDTTVADGAGNWSANFPQIPAGQTLTALQLDPADGSSELAEAVVP